ncbi:hypothetical protein [Solitalea canadensis]|uniref:hypothetical protein n=1 Tax=Solitalea canadensis TaxID=995 RepID=UPI0002471D31|nr:hypothetical protein [Solitalea canadensis]
MRKLLLFICICMYALSSYGQTTGSFVVNGDFDKYYPVTFVDEGYLSNMTTELEIGRSNVHMDAQWRGSLNALFRFHTFNYGNASHFIDAVVNQFNLSSSNTLIAGWQDVTNANGG